jgi:hypothetical protein
MGYHREIGQAVPPSYTEFIGQQLMAHLGASVGEGFALRTVRCIANRGNRDNPE